MAEASPVDVALFAFRKRDERFVLTGASIAFAILSYGIAAMLLAAALPAVFAVVHWEIETARVLRESGVPEPPIGRLASVAPWCGLAALLSLVLYAAYEAACLRWLVRAERGGFFGLTLGADTWRVFAAYFVWLALGIVFAVCVVGFYMGLNAVSGAAPVLRIPVMLAAALAPLALAGLMIWVAVRLSPATAACIARRRFAFFDAWTATRGRFWELLGAFVIVLAVYAGVGIFVSAVIRFPMAQAMYPILQEVLAGGAPETIIGRAREVFTTPLVVASAALYVLATTVLAMLVYVAWFGVNAHAAVAALEQGKLEPAMQQEG